MAAAKVIGILFEPCEAGTPTASALYIGVHPEQLDGPVRFQQPQRLASPAAGIEHPNARADGIELEGPVEPLLAGLPLDLAYMVSNIAAERREAAIRPDQAVFGGCRRQSGGNVSFVQPFSTHFRSH